MNLQSLKTETYGISLLIPPSFNLNQLRSFLVKELSVAPNIKSKEIRNSVKSALTKIQVYVGEMKSLPETGIAIYAESYI